MKAVVAHGAGDLRVEQRPLPDVGPGQVLIRVAQAGICGSDLSYYRHGAVGAFAIRHPMVVGHEVAGRVERDPSGQWSAGTPVTIHPATPGPPPTASGPLPTAPGHPPTASGSPATASGSPATASPPTATASPPTAPGTPPGGLASRPNIWPGSRYLGSAATDPHTDGAMAQFTVVRADQLRLLPPDLPLSRAVLAEPLAVALHAIARAGGVRGQRVLVSGAGPIGLLVTGVAVNQGAAHVAVVDLAAEPLARAAAQGAHALYQAPRDGLPAAHFDVALECSGAASALSAALAATRSGGVVVQVGIMPAAAQPVAIAELATRELDLRGSFRFVEELDGAVALLAACPSLGLVVTDVFPVDQVQAAFELASDARASGRVVVDLWAD